MTDTTNIVTTAVDAMELENDSASKETTKTLIIVAATAVTLIGAPKVARLARDKFIEFRIARLNKMADRVHVVTDLPETEIA